MLAETEKIQDAPQTLNILVMLISTGVSDRNQTLYSLGQNSILFTYISKLRLTIQIAAELGMYRPSGIFEAGMYSNQVILGTQLYFFSPFSFFLSHCRLGLPNVDENTLSVAPEFYALKPCHQREARVLTIYSPL